MPGRTIISGCTRSISRRALKCWGARPRSPRHSPAAPLLPRSTPRPTKSARHCCWPTARSTPAGLRTATSPRTPAGSLRTLKTRSPESRCSTSPPTVPAVLRSGWRAAARPSMRPETSTCSRQTAPSKRRWTPMDFRTKETSATHSSRSRAPAPDSASWTTLPCRTKWRSRMRTRIWARAAKCCCRT